MNESKVYQKEDQTIIQRCLQNDQAAFEHLYRAYNKAMYNVCLRMLNHSAEAEDVLQESFINAFKNIQNYSQTSSFGAWLKRIVINKCIDVLRKRDLNLIPLEQTTLLEVTEAEDTDMHYDSDSIKKALKLLPDGYRMILCLYVFEEYTHQQIAEKLGIQEGTSKSQYARAKKKLIELMQLTHTSHAR